MGLIDATLFSVVIAIGFLTTIITPIIAKPFIYRSMSKRSIDAEIKREKTESKLSQNSHFDFTPNNRLNFHSLIDKIRHDKLS
jgi:H+/gluconate symporter-like permease